MEGGIVGRTVNSVRLEQYEKTLNPNEVTEIGIVMDERLIQAENAYSPIDSKLFESVIKARFQQPANASFSIIVTELGIVTDVRPPHL